MDSSDQRSAAGIAVFFSLFAVSSMGFSVYQQGTNPALPGFYTIQTALASDYRLVQGAESASALDAAIIKSATDIATLNTYVNSAVFVNAVTTAGKSKQIPQIQQCTATCLAAINNVVASL
jgi:hypothetical protein